MAGRLFDKLEQEAFRAGIAARTKASMNWFQDQVSTMSVSRPALIKDGPTRARQIYGMMYNFQYDPKTKKTLPYYDRFPLVIPIQPAKKGFHGMNLHYIAPNLRAQFLDALMDITNNNNYDRSTKFKLTYKLMQGAKKYRFFRPCFKHYLSEHIKTKLLLIEPQDWEIAIFLPTEQFVRKSKATVWKESRKMLQ